MNDARERKLASRWHRILFALVLQLPVFCGVETLAQTPPAAPPPIDPLLQLMISQPSIEVSSNFQVTAAFEPPMVRPGAKTIYRFTVNALSDSVEWPEKVEFPAALAARLSARSQNLSLGEGKLKPTTAINYHVRAAGEGNFIVPSFSIRVYGREVAVPAATLQVSATAAPNPPPSLAVRLEATNVFAGQPVRVEVQMRGSPGNIIQGVQDLKISGEGFLVDLAAARQSINMLPEAEGPMATFRYETTLSPLRTGDLELSASGFVGGNRFGGAVVIQGQVTIPGGVTQLQFIDSEPVKLHVRPLPRGGELPGFTGAIGVFDVDPPNVSTNRVKTGELLKLTVVVKGQGNLARLVPPPPPVSTEWQIYAATAGGVGVTPGGAPLLPGSAAVFTYTLIPLSAQVRGTPAIPFSYFNPEQGSYVDATIPSVPVTVETGGDAPDARTFAALTQSPVAEEKKLRLSDVTDRPGASAATLLPLQLRGWFLVIQVAPVIGFLALWQWDRRRRFLERHPDILLRRRARRALKRERRKLARALGTGDEREFVHTAVNALRIAVSADYAAEPRALVCGDVIRMLGDDEQGKQTVRRFFAVFDAAEFSSETAKASGLLTLREELEIVLNSLEARL